MQRSSRNFIDHRFRLALLAVLVGQHEAEVLLKMTRALYPHDRFGDVYYAEVVEALDEKAKADGSIVELVKDGVAQLDGGP